MPRIPAAGAAGEGPAAGTANPRPFPGDATGGVWCRLYPPLPLRPHPGNVRKQRISEKEAPVEYLSGLWPGVARSCFSPGGRARRGSLPALPRPALPLPAFRRRRGQSRWRAARQPLGPLGPSTETGTGTPSAAALLRDLALSATRFTGPKGTRRERRRTAAPGCHPRPQQGRGLRGTRRRR